MADIIGMRRLRPVRAPSRADVTLRGRYQHAAAGPSVAQAILLTDGEGRTCTYLPFKVDGRVVDSKGFRLEPSQLQTVGVSGLANCFSDARFCGSPRR
jgi:hypothetical protein